MARKPYDMSQWPFVVFPSDDQLMVQEAIDCLDYLESYLDFEEWQMDQIETHENGEFDDDDDDAIEMMIIVDV